MAAEAAKDKGNTAVKLGDWQLALANYNTAMQIDPSIYTYPLNASLMHLKLNQHAEAEKCATIALNLMPGNPKALYRRGVARKQQGKLDKAKEDFSAALQAGAGPDVQVELEQTQRLIDAQIKTRELNGVESQSGKFEASPDPSPSTSKATPATSSSPSVSRLRAAVSSRDAKPSSKSSATEGSDLMRPVSSRRLKPTPSVGSEANPFAAKKEARDARNNLLKRAPANPPSRESLLPTVSPETFVAPNAQPAISPSAPPIASPDVPRVIAPATSKRESDSSAGILPSSGSRPTSHPSTKSAASPGPVSQNGSSFRDSKLPTTAAALEQALCASNLPPQAKLNILRSLDPATLPSLLGSSFTPDLLSASISVLATDDDDEGAREEAWKIAFLKGLSRVQRSSSVIAFMDESERQTVREILNRGQRELDSLHAIWQL